jgi:HSP20 family protein
MAQTKSRFSVEDACLAGSEEHAQFRFYHFYSGPRPMLASRAMSWTPPVDLYETASEIVLEVDLAGIEPGNVQIQVSDRLVHLQGMREQSGESGVRCYEIMEIERGNFERSVELPSSVDSDQAKATYHDGVLVLRMAKIQAKPLDV